MKNRGAVISVSILIAVTLVAGNIFMIPAQASSSAIDQAISIEEVIQDGDRVVLRIKNRTPFILIIYIAGVRVGWLRPQRVALMRGISRGYHKLHAHTRYGTTAWGPKEIWVPGTWNILY